MASDHEPINPIFAEAPRTGLAPLWVHYSGVPVQSRELADLLVAAAMQGPADRAAPLDREFFAWCLGVSRSDKGLQPYLDKLVEIGFLVIFDGGRDEKGRRRKRRDPVTNQIVADTFAVRLDAPAEYVGPRNETEARAAFEADREVAYAAHAKAGKRGVVAIPRRYFGYLSGEIFPQVNPTPPTKGEATPPTEGVGRFPQVNPTPPTKGELDRGIEDPSSRDLRSDRSSAEQDPAGAGPVHAHDERQSLVEQLTQLIRRLPWKSVGVKQVRVGEERRMAEAMLEAVEKRGLSFEQVKDHALHSMVQARSNPVVYVIGAFQDEDNLPVRLEEDDAYELPPRLRAVEDLPEEPLQEAALPEWCGECGEGNPAARWNPRLRFHGMGTREERKCSCHPAHEGAA